MQWKGRLIPPKPGFSRSRRGLEYAQDMLDVRPTDIIYAGVILDQFCPVREILDSFFAEQTPVRMH